MIKHILLGLMLCGAVNASIYPSLDSIPTGTNSLQYVYAGTNLVWTKQINYALIFDGVNDWVEIADAPAYDLTGDFTISTWAKRADEIGLEVMVGKFWDGSTRGWYFGISSDDLGGTRCRFLHYEASSSTSLHQYNSDTYDFTATNLHYFVATHNATAGTYTVYIDGVSSNGAESACAVEINNAKMTVGEAVHTTLNPFLPFNGSIGRVFIYNKELTQSEITTMYEKGMGASVDVADLVFGVSPVPKDSTIFSSTYIPTENSYTDLLNLDDPAMYFGNTGTGDLGIEEIK